MTQEPSATKIDPSDPYSPDKIRVGCPAGFSSSCSSWTSNDVCRCNTIEHQHAQQAIIIRALREEIVQLNSQIGATKEHFQRRCDTLTAARDRATAELKRLQPYAIGTRVNVGLCPGTVVEQPTRVHVILDGLPASRAADFDPQFVHELQEGE